MTRLLRKIPTLVRVVANSDARTTYVPIAATIMTVKSSNSLTRLAQTNTPPRKRAPEPRPPMSPQPAASNSPPERMVIAVDAMGGDTGPSAVVDGIARSARINPSITFILHGPEAELAKLVARRRQLRGRVEIRHAANVVKMKDKPSSIIRHGKDTSMWSTLDTVRNGKAEVAVSCGNTGALLGLSMARLRTMPNVDRPAIAVLWPSGNPQRFNVLLDAGGQIHADAEALLQFALMGASYAHCGLDLPKPRIGLLNVGTEEHKGRPELKQAHALIAKAADEANFRFVGFVEGRDIPGEVCDVIVTDGFTGNVAVKTGEGTAALIGNLLKDTFRQSILSRTAWILAITSLRQLRKRIDPRHVNGGVILGLNGTVVKSHGSADATGVSAAVKLAFQLAENGFTEKLRARVALNTAITEDSQASRTANPPTPGKS